MILFRLIGDEMGPLGWSVYHFIWQGMLVAALYSITCLICAKDARRRYRVACLYLVIALALPAWQVWMILNRHHGFSVGIGPPEELLPWMTWAALIWLGFAAAMTMRALSRVGKLKRVWLAGAFEDPELSDAAKTLAPQMGLTEAPRVLRSRTADGMAIIGSHHPIVIVPAETPEGVTGPQFSSLLAHELAHVARRDPLVNLFLSVMESAVLFHPAAAWLAIEVRRLREYCCDDMAVRVVGDSLVYARGLTALARMPRVKDSSLTLPANGGDLKARVVRLVSKPAWKDGILSDGRRFVLWLAAAAALMSACKTLCRLM